MKSQFLIIAFSFLSIFTEAQIDQTVIVEHFTNTRCSNCAGRNPSLFTNLDNNQDVLHIAFHPSSPYPSCIFNKHNVSENDARTKFYGVYGSTPRLVIQGDVQSNSVNFGSSTLFSSYQNKTTEAEIKFNTNEINGNKVNVSVTLMAKASNSLGSVILNVFLTEKEIEYNAPNGEKLHHNVFRLAMSDIEGDMVDFPANDGDSVAVDFSVDVNSEWNLDELRAVAYLQNQTSNEVVQASESNSFEKVSDPTIIENLFAEGESVIISPNPVSDILTIYMERSNCEFSIMNSSGQVIFESRLGNGTKSIDVNEFENGIYVLNFNQGGKRILKKFIKY